MRKRRARGRPSPAEVCLFTDTVAFGGAEAMLLGLAAGLDRAVWRPVLVHHADGDHGPLLERADELEIERWVVPRLPDGLEGARLLPGFVRGLQRRAPAVFHAHLTWPLACKFGLVGAVAARVPAVVATVQLFPSFRPTRLTSLQYRWLGVAVGRYIAVSADIARQLRETFEWRAERIDVIHNGIDASGFRHGSNDRLRAELSRGSSRPVVLTLARLDAQKGLAVLLRAARDVPDAQFVVAGEGSERGALEALAGELALADRVTFLGHRDDVPDLLASCDLLALPSLYEGLPIAVLEAMAASRPVVASAVAGTTEAVVDGETGLLVPPNDPVALTNAIRTVLQDRVLAARLGAAGRARVEAEFSRAAMVQAVSGVYEELLRR